MDLNSFRFPVDNLKEIFTHFPVNMLRTITLVSRFWRTVVIDPYVLASMVAVTERMQLQYLKSQFGPNIEASHSFLPDREALTRSVILPVVKKNMKIYCKSICYAEDDLIIFRSLLRVPNFFEDALLDGSELMCLLERKAMKCVKHLFGMFPKALDLESIDRATDLNYRQLRRLLVYLITNTSSYYEASVKVTIARYSVPQDDGKPPCAPPLVRFAPPECPWNCGYNMSGSGRYDSPWDALATFLNIHTAMMLEVATSLLMLNCGEKYRNATFDCLCWLSTPETTKVIVQAKEKLNERQREQEAKANEYLKQKQELERRRVADELAEQEKRLAFMKARGGRIVGANGLW